MRCMERVGGDKENGNIGKGRRVVSKREERRKQMGGRIGRKWVVREDRGSEKVGWEKMGG